MFGCAIAWGHRPETVGDPCHGIALYRRPPRGWLLSAEDLSKHGAVPRRLEAGSPFRVAAVRLVLLIVCRPGEMRRLRWCKVKADRLTLNDGKTGPRHVLLGEAARAPLDDLVDTACRACSSVRTETNRYIHLDDATLSHAPERVAIAIQGRLVVGYDSITATTD